MWPVIILSCNQHIIGVPHVAHQLDFLQVLGKGLVEPLHMPWVRQVLQLPL